APRRGLAQRREPRARSGPPRRGGAGPRALARPPRRELSSPPESALGLQLHVSFNGRPVGKWALDRPHMNIGRSPDNEIQLDAQVVSRRHAVLEQAGAGWILRDLGTVNGTYLNGARVEGQSPLREGDTIQVGSFNLVYGDETQSPSTLIPALKAETRKSGDGW